MPNRDTHLIAGALAGAALPLILPRDKEEHLLDVIAEMFFTGSAGSIAGILPDILEPAESPNHREFFHSVGFGALLGYGEVKVVQYLVTEFDSLDNMERFLLILAASSIIGLLLHLAMDGFTPKGLPLL